MTTYIYEETFSYEIEADSPEGAVKLFEENDQDYADGSEGVTFVAHTVEVFDDEGKELFW